MLCPLCSCVNTEIVKLIEVEPVVALWRDSFRIDVRQEFHNLSQIELWRCSDCCISFFAPEILTGSAQIYSQLDKIDWYYMPNKWEYELALKDLAGCEKVLEIGSGSGSFIMQGRIQLGLDIEGLEQNANAIDLSVQRSLNVRAGTVEEIATQSPGVYDAVCSFQVLEHVPRPGEFLAACCKLLHPGGRLLLGLPNAASYLRHQFNPLDMPPHHMTRWTWRTLDKLQEHFPLRLVRSVREPLPEYQVEWYVNTYYAALSDRRLRHLVHPGIRSRLIRALRRYGSVRHLLHGQTIYAYYVRIEGVT